MKFTVVNKLIRSVATRYYRPMLQKYLARERTYSYRSIRLVIPSGVFHPGFFFSSKFLLRFLAGQPLRGRSFLELGAGSGLISLFAAGQGADVTATDINPLAIDCLHTNRGLNAAVFEIVHSDLYRSLPHQQFDIVAVNPPYYRKQPSSDAQRAWYCGPEGEYFDSFFSGLGAYIHERSEVWMVLCEGCDLPMIRNLASRYGWALRLARTRRNWIERDYIFQIVPLAMSIL